MKLFREVIIIFGIAYAGDILSKLLHLPIPGSLVGMLILLFLLKLRILRLDQIAQISDFLLGHLPFFFIPAGVALIAIFPLIATSWPWIILLCFITTIITMGITGFSIEKIMERGKHHDDMD